MKCKIRKPKPQVLGIFDSPYFKVKFIKEKMMKAKSLQNVWFLVIFFSLRKRKQLRWPPFNQKGLREAIPIVVDDPTLHPYSHLSVFKHQDRGREGWRRRYEGERKKTTL